MPCQQLSGGLLSAHFHFGRQKFLHPGDTHPAVPKLSHNGLHALLRNSQLFSQCPLGDPTVPSDELVGASVARRSRCRPGSSAPWSISQSGVTAISAGFSYTFRPTSNGTEVATLVTINSLQSGMNTGRRNLLGSQKLDNSALFKPN